MLSLLLNYDVFKRTRRNFMSHLTVINVLTISSASSHTSLFRYMFRYKRMNENRKDKGKTIRVTCDIVERKINHYYSASMNVAYREHAENLYISND